MEPVPLSQFVEALREEIRLMAGQADEQVPIELGPVSVEFTLLSRREGEGKAGVRFWVVEAGAAVRTANESTQKVTMQLQPLQPGGEGHRRIRDRG